MSNSLIKSFLYSVQNFKRKVFLKYFWKAFRKSIDIFPYVCLANGAYGDR